MFDQLLHRLARSVVLVTEPGEVVATVEVEAAVQMPLGQRIEPADDDFGPPAIEASDQDAGHRAAGQQQR